jgi:hypothetical protein
VYALRITTQKVEEVKTRKEKPMPPQILASNLENWFTCHSPTPEQLPKYQKIREAAFAFATVVLENTPPSADQSAAIRKIREATMTANAAIACRGE